MVDQRSGSPNFGADAAQRSDVAESVGGTL